VWARSSERTGSWPAPTAGLTPSSASPWSTPTWPGSRWSRWSRGQSSPPPSCRRQRSVPCDYRCRDMDVSHRQRVETLLADAAAEHASLMSQLPPEIAASLPVDAQGVTQAIDHLATAAGLSAGERRELIRPHAVNPAVLHARVFGAAPLARETVIGSFVEGARVRADALTALADAVGGEPLGETVRQLLVAN